MVEKSLTNCPLLDSLECICNNWLRSYFNFFSADNSSQIFEGRQNMYLTLRLLTPTTKNCKIAFLRCDLIENSTKRILFFQTLLVFGLKVVLAAIWKETKKHSGQIERRKNTFRLCLSEVLKAKKKWGFLRYDSYMTRKLHFSTFGLEIIKKLLLNRHL